MRILEIDQFNASANNWDEVDFIQKDLKGVARYKDVEESDTPLSGYVWLIDNGGKCKIWKYNYDTSD